MSALKQKHQPKKPGVPTVAQFIGNLSLGMDFLQTAGAQLVQMKKDDFDVFDRILEECDWLTLEMLECIHKVGERVLHPKLLLMPKHVFDRVAGLPYAEQERAVTMPVDVPSEPTGSDHKSHYERKPAAALSRAEAARVWPSAKKLRDALSPRFTLYVETAERSATLVPATTGGRAQIVVLDENGEAVVQFRQRKEPATPSLTPEAGRAQ